MPPAQNKGAMQLPTRKVIYKGTDTLLNGYAVAFDTTQSAANDRERIITKPTWANLLTQNAFAGVVCNAPVSSSGTRGYVGTGSTNGIEVEIIPYDGRISQNVDVYTDQNVAAGDILAPIPGTYLFGRAVMFQPVFQARAASDRSATAGVANGVFGPVSGEVSRGSVLRVFNDFLGDTPIFTQKDAAASLEYVAGGYTLQGASATAQYNGSAAGELVLTANSTNIAQLNGTGFTGSNTQGQPFLLATGKSAFIRARYKTSNIDADTFFGLAIGASTTVATNAALTDAGYVSAQDDYFGFVTDGDTSGAIKFAYNKDNGTDRAIAAGVSLVADTYVDVAALVVNRNSGTTVSTLAKYGMVWANGTLLTGTANPSVGTDVDAQGRIDMSDLFNDDEGLCLVAATIGGARLLTIDRWEAVMCR